MLLSYQKKKGAAVFKSQFGSRSTPDPVLPPATGGNHGSTETLSSEEKGEELDFISHVRR
jgi:hypothetical protein